MGQRIIALASEEKDLEVVGAVEAAGSLAVGREAGGVRISDSLEKVVSLGDVLIDFSSPEATVSNLKAVTRAKKAAVIGTTGHAPDQKKEIEKVASEIPLVMAPNMSVGVNVLWKLIGEAAKIFGQEFKVDVTEIHHIHKKDKPSGTALQIVHVLSKALGVPPEEIPVKSVREGEVVGDHLTVFTGPGETLEITHRASSRDTFALGALRAARWIVGKPNGLYSMADVLAL